jgi:hypothetical protein
LTILGVQKCLENMVFFACFCLFFQSWTLVRVCKWFAKGEHMRVCCTSIRNDVNMRSVLLFWKNIEKQKSLMIFEKKFFFIFWWNLGVHFWISCMDVSENGKIADEKKNKIGKMLYDVSYVI